MEQATGRDEVVDGERGRAGSPPRAPPTSRAAATSRRRPTKRKNGAANTTVRRDVQARPNRKPARTCRPSGTSQPRPSRRPARGRGRRRGRRPRDAGAVGVAAGRPRRIAAPPVRAQSATPIASKASADRQDVGLVPGRPELGGVPEHRPEAEEHASRPRGPTSGSAAWPSTHQASPTSSAPRIAKIELAVGREAPERDERQQERPPAAAGREPAPRGTPSLEATGRTSWKKALPGDVAGRPRPGSGSRPGPRGRPWPATEVVVDSDRDG